jgi:16S rRNA (guanine527-N7)-methyltransferase
MSEKKSLLDDLRASLPATFEEQASAYAELINEANQKFNLTAIKDGEAIYHELVLDSLTLLPELDKQARNVAFIREVEDVDKLELHVLDLGSGAGIPGLPLAIARPNWRITCLDATGKKAAFIGEAAEQLGLANVTSLHDRSEDLAHKKLHREQYDAVVMRFVGAMNEACELGLPFLRLMGWLWCLKFQGKDAEKEAREARGAAGALGGDEIEQREAPNDRLILGVQKIYRSPKQYPRNPGVPKNNPIKNK